MLLKRLQYAIRRGRMPKEGMKAVHDDDLEGFLSSIRLLHKVRAGKVRCKFCREILDLESIQAVFPESGSVSVVCSREQCIKDFLSYLGGSK